MIPYIYNPLGISNNKSIYPENVSVFSIYGNSLTSMYVTPVENCIIDFGDGNKQILEGTNTSTLVEHTYDIEDEYIIKIMGNHYTFQASKNIGKGYNFRKNSIKENLDILEKLVNLIVGLKYQLALA